jgi:hypothetical protein
MGTKTLALPSKQRPSIPIRPPLSLLFHLAYFLVFDHTVEVIDPVKLGNKKNKKFHP